MDEHCPECPLISAGVDGPCPSARVPQYCGHVRREARRGNGPGWWTRRILGLAGVEVPDLPAPKVPVVTRSEPVAIGPSRAELLARVSACPDRGGVLPISLQDDCGCRGKELTECRAGKGKVAGRVTMNDCLACVRAQSDSATVPSGQGAR